MKKMKRFLSLLLVMAMVLTNVPLEASAEETTDSSATASSADVNMALNKSVVVSAVTEGSGANIVDGDLDTRWGTWAEGTPYGVPQSVTVDLEATSTIRKFVIYNENTDSQKIRKFKIEGSNDGINYSMIHDSEDNAAGFDLQYEVSLEEACDYRFVKLTIENLIDTVDTINCVSLREFEIWGTPGEVVHYEYEQFNPVLEGDANYTYLLEKNAISNTWSRYGNDGPPSYAFNGVSDNWWHTRWDSGGEGPYGTALTWTEVTEISAFSEIETENTRAWIGSSFGESITLGRFTYKGRTDSANVHNNWINQYAFYVANATDGVEPDDTDWKLVATGYFATNTENVVTLANPVQATHFRLVAFTNSSTDHVTASEIEIYTATEIGIEDMDLPKAGSIDATADTVTNEQPFAAGTAGSDIFRIPCLITLQNSGNLLAVADARHTVFNDWGGIDTIASVSANGGETWNYSFPINFPDSAGATTDGALSTVAIDPVIVQGLDGTIYCLADVNPTGIATQTSGGATYPGAGTGYVTINGEERLALTSRWANASTKPSNEDITTYEYYVGDFIDGYAPVLRRNDNTTTGWVVDAWYNIYSLDEKGEPVADLAQEQVDDSETLIQQNAFYKDSILHVYNTGYIWLVTSTDGLTWGDPQILNPQIKRDGETALLVSPGRGLVTENGDIVIGCYNTLNSEDASFFYSTDNGLSWTRTNDVPNSSKESENEIVELNNNTLRMFYRNYNGKLTYADATMTETDGTRSYSFGEEVVVTDISVEGDCNLSAIKLSQRKINEKDVVLVSCPGGSGRNNGKIFTFLVDEDNSMELYNTYSVNEGAFAYSCMTELNDGNLGILWEPGNGAAAAVRYDEVDIGYVLGLKKDVNLKIGKTYTENYVVDSKMEVTAEPNSTIAKLTIDESRDYRIPMYNHESNQASSLSSFSSEDNTEITLEEAEFTFNASGENWQIYNEAKQLYLANDSNAGSFFTETQTAMKVESVVGDGVTEFRISKTDATRYIMFYFNNMDFNGNGGGYNSSLSNGSQELVLLEKKDTVSVDDIVPGYTRADTITSGNKYLISYIWEDERVIVLYPTNGTANQTKLVGEVAWATMYNQDGTTLATDINIEDAEFRFTAGSSDNTWQILSVAKEMYLQNVGNTQILTASENDMVVTAGSKDGSFYIYDHDNNRYFVFYATNKNFNAMSKTPYEWDEGSYNLLLLEKQNSISSNDVIPGYAEITGVDQIDSTKTYLIAYDYEDEDVIYVLYPTEASFGNAITKVVEPATPVLTNKLSIEGVAPGTTKAVVDGVTYNITVVIDPDDASRDIPVEHLEATAGCYQSDAESPAKVLDGDLNTMWHTTYGTTPEGERWITFEIAGSYTVDGLRYLPRSGAGNGTITQYVIEVSDDNTNWTPVAEGNWEQIDGYKSASFEGKNVKYVRLRAVTSVGGFVSAREIRLTGVENEIDVTLKDIVVDFGLPVEYTFQSNEEITGGTATYGGVTVTSEAYGNLYNNTITYTPTSVLKAADTITLTDSNGDTFTMNVYPATSVYYEEGFANYDTAKAWDSTGSKGTDTQTLQTLEESSTGHYGYDAKYAAESKGSSNGTQAVSNTVDNDNPDNNVAGQKATFAFTGTGVDVYANCGAETGSAAIVISSTDEGNTYKKLMVVNTEMAGEGEGTASSGHNGIDAYNIPIVSVSDLTHGNYEVAITHVKTSYKDESGNYVQEVNPIKLDGFRVYNTLADSNEFNVHNEANPNFFEMRDVVLNALTVDFESEDYNYAEDVAEKLTQVLDTKENGNGVDAVILDQNDQNYASGNAQDLLDNGPKNELFLYPEQSLVFNLSAGLKNVQIGMKAVNDSAAVQVQKGSEYILGSTETMNKVITSNTDMFYLIGDITEDATSITITNKGTSILSITELKVPGGVTEPLMTLTAEDLVPALLSMGYMEKPGVVNPFADVTADDYFYNAVLWALENSVTAGTGTNTFSPNAACTRGQVVTFLWNAAGRPSVDGTSNPFADVAEEAYYYEAVLWAVKEGITAGTSANTFEPDATCTRAQVAAFLWRVAKRPAVKEASAPFADVAEGAYYHDAILWAVEKGIAYGTSTSTFEPDETCTRAQIVTFLYRAR